MSYFFIPPSKEFCQSFFVCDGTGYAVLTVDGHDGSTALYHEEAAGAEKIAWHNATVLVDPFQVQATVVSDEMPLDERKLRQRFSHLNDQPYVAVGHAEKGSGLLSTISTEVFEDTVKSAHQLGIYPNKVEDASIAWYGLCDYFSVVEDDVSFAIINDRTVLFCVFDQGALTHMESLIWDEDVGDVTSFVLTEMTPLLQTHGLLDNSHSLVVVDCQGGAFFTDLVAVLENKMQMSEVRQYQSASMGSLVVGLYQCVYAKFVDVVVLPFRTYRQFPFVRWLSLFWLLLGFTVLNIIYIAFFGVIQTGEISQLEEKLSEYDGIYTEYVGTYTPTALNMVQGLDGFFPSLSCSLPGSIWLTAAVVQLPQQNFYMQGYMREKVNLYDFSNVLVTQLGWSKDDIHINFVDASSLVELMPAKLWSLREGKEYKVDIWSKKPRAYDARKRMDALSFMVTNLGDGEVLTF